MREIAGELVAARARGQRFALAVLVAMTGSGPRSPGAALVLLDDGRVLGSLSGGCLDGAALTACAELLGSPGGPARSRLIGGQGEDGFADVGLTCGGAATVLVTRDDLLGENLLDSLAYVAAGRAARLVLRHGPDEVLTLEVPAQPRLVLVGATVEAGLLCRLATEAGWRVTVVDPRPAFATKERAPGAELVVRAWPAGWLADELEAGRGPGPEDALLLMAHDDRYDIDLLAAALSAGVGFVGALASRATASRRQELLAASGLDAATVARLVSPLGLDLRGPDRRPRDPAGVAVSVLAQLVQRRP